MLAYAAGAYEHAAGLGHEAVQVSLGLVPEGHRHVHHVAHEAQRCQRAVQEQRQQISLVLLVWKHKAFRARLPRGQVLGRRSQTFCLRRVVGTFGTRSEWNIKET